MKLSAIESSHIEEAFRRLIAGEDHPFQDPEKYWVDYEGNKYRPKAVTWFAACIAEQREVPGEEVFGGWRHSNKILRKHGYKILIQTEKALPLFSALGNVWVEITKDDHAHGGSGWDFGTCLWSPTSNRSGDDRYSIMRKPDVNDLVLHIYRQTPSKGKPENSLCAVSRVAGPCRITQEQPPSPGETWGGRDEYYRIDLKHFAWLTTPLPIPVLIDNYGGDIREELKRTKANFFPFNTHGAGMRTVQGIYLAQCTEGLYSIFEDALQVENTIESSGTSEGDAQAARDEYEEGRRMARERRFFSRNPALVRAAKETSDYTCVVCGLRLEDYYGPVGHGYIECHHRNPLSERPASEWDEDVKTKVEDIDLVCANCHRMIHRERGKTLSIEQLREMILRSADPTKLGALLGAPFNR